MKPSFLLNCLLFTFVLVLSSSPALAKRAALIIGNGDYRVGGLLSNPTNDAQLVESALRKARFDVVEAKRNLGIAGMRQALRRFQSLADGAEVAIIYFAGHGVEAAGANWLLPVDAELGHERDLEYEAIRLDLALQALAGARMRILALDACRNNPFGRSWRTSARSVNRGLRQLETDDVLVLFAAAPGQVANDGDGTNSPFATALANRLPEAGVAIQLLGGLVRDDVLKATGGAQRPYVSASITGQPFYLMPAAQPADQAFWNAVKDSRDAGLIGNYLTKFPQGTFADTARVILDQLKTERERSEAVAVREAELAKAEEAKRRAEAHQLEAERKAEAARQSEELKKAQDELSNAREALASAQREKAAAEKAAAAARQMQDEARKQTEVTAKGETEIAALPTREVQAPHLTKALVRSIQTELKRLRCYRGELDGEWGKQAQAAYGNYARRAKVINAAQEPSQLMLDGLLNEKKASCPLECESGFIPSNGSCVAAPKPATAEREPARQAPAKPTANRPDALSHSYKIWPLGTASRILLSKKTEFGTLECQTMQEGIIRLCRWQ
jgi:uncharacterized caspase-like protein